MHKEGARNRFDRIVLIIFVALLALLFILCGLLFIEYHRLRSLGGMHLHHSALPVTNANFVQPWMTYDYVSHVYALPPDYLKTTLSVADTRYPRVSIEESAEAQRLSASQMLAEVRQAVALYLTTHASTSTNATST